MKTTKEKLLHLGECLIQKQGYFGFSYYQLAEQLGIKHAAIHYHFKRKEDLGNAIIQHNILRIQTAFQQWSSLSDWQKIEAFINIYRPNNDTERICIIGALGADFVNLPPSLQTDLQQLVQLLWNWLSTVLEEGRTNQSFYFKDDARTKAMMMCTNMMAGLQLARILGTEKFEQICQALKADLRK